MGQGIRNKLLVFVGTSWDPRNPIMCRGLRILLSFCMYTFRLS